MIYLDNGATTFPKPPAVRRAVAQALETCANPGRGGYEAAMAASRLVYRCREAAGELFHCKPEQVVMTSSATHGLNIAIRSLVQPGDRVVITGFEHNAVLRPLTALGAELVIAGRKLFSWEDTLEQWERALNTGPRAAVFTHVSNVFGYILPVAEMARMCRSRRIPFILDGAQSAGTLEVDMEKLGADFIAMPGHKGLLGPQGTGLLLCAGEAQPLLYGGTGSQSRERAMPRELPERLEPGTMNVPGIAGLLAGIQCVKQLGPEKIFRREHSQLLTCAQGLNKLGMQVFTGEHQGGTLSFLPGGDCEEAAQILADRGLALRAGLHCAPLAHESAGTIETGTLRLSLGPWCTPGQISAFLRAAGQLPKR